VDCPEPVAMRRPGRGWILWSLRSGEIWTSTNTTTCVVITMQVVVKTFCRFEIPASVPLPQPNDSTSTGPSANKARSSFTGSGVIQTLFCR